MIYEMAKLFILKMVKSCGSRMICRINEMFEMGEKLQDKGVSYIV